MSVKQDLTHTRTASQLEQKYSFGKKFAEIIGLIDDSRDRVDSVESTLSNEIASQWTNLSRSVHDITMEAMAEYETKTDAEQHRQELKSELEVRADGIDLNFSSLEERVNTTEGKTEKLTTELDKHFEFDANGLTIKTGKNELKLRIDNDIIAFYKGEIDESDLSKNRLGYWDGNDFYTGNIIVSVNEKAQFGNFAYVPRSNGSLSFLLVKKEGD